MFWLLAFGFQLATLVYSTEQSQGETLPVLSRALFGERAVESAGTSLDVTEVMQRTRGGCLLMRCCRRELPRYLFAWVDNENTCL